MKHAHAVAKHQRRGLMAAVLRCKPGQRGNAANHGVLTGSAGRLNDCGRGVLGPASVSECSSHCGYGVRRIEEDKAQIWLGSRNRRRGARFAWY